MRIVFQGVNLFFSLPFPFQLPAFTFTISVSLKKSFTPLRLRGYLLRALKSRRHYFFYPYAVEVKKMIMNEKEKSRVWDELVKSSDKKMGVVRKEKIVRRKERIGWRVELVSDLKLLVMVELVGCGLFVLLELLKY